MKLLSMKGILLFLVASMTTTTTTATTVAAKTQKEENVLLEQRKVDLYRQQEELVLLLSEHQQKPTAEEEEEDITEYSSSQLNRELRRTKICSDEFTTGYDNWGDLMTDITNAGLSNMNGGTYILCPNTLFDASTIIDVRNTGVRQKWLQIFSSNVVIKCGYDGSSSNNCEVQNGENGIVVGNSIDGIDTINNPPTGIIIRGITFGGGMDGTQAPALSIGVMASGNDVIMQDCIFINGTSSATAYVGAYIFNGASLSIRDSLFQNNLYGSAVIVEGTLNIQNSYFVNNVALWQDSLIPTIKGGEVSIESSCFIDNTATTGKGIITADSTSTIVRQFNNHASGNEGKSVSIFCNGIYNTIIGTSNEQQQCIQFDQNECIRTPYKPPPFQLNIEPTISPAPTVPKARGGAVLCTDGITIGYDSIAQINNEANFGNNGAQKFVLCPNTFFDLSAFGGRTLNMYSNMIIQCGDDGLSLNKCIFSGSGSTTIQVNIFAQQSNMKLIGITFQRSRSRSISSGENTNPNNKIEFIDCHWDDTPIDISNDGTTLDISLRISSMIYLDMTAIFKHCTFNNNNPTTSMIEIASNGSVTFYDCIITNNKPMIRPITVAENGKISLTRTCFIDNEFPSNIPGLIGIHKSGNWYINDNNYASNNGDIVTCGNSIVKFNNDNNDNYDCIEMTSSTCLALPVPTPAPTRATTPTKSPIANTNPRPPSTLSSGGISTRIIIFSSSMNFSNICISLGMMTVLGTLLLQ